MKYNKLEASFKKGKLVKGEKLGVATLEEHEARQLNKKAITSGVCYELANETKSNIVKINDVDYEKTSVINAINSQEFDGVKKITTNTGVVKVTEKYEALTDEQKEIVNEYLTV